MRVVAFCLMMAALSIVSVQANAEKGEISGGPFQGMIMGDMVTPGEYAMYSVHPSRPNASPVPKGRADVIALLINAVEQNQKFEAALLAEGAVSRYCPLTEKVFCETDKPLESFAVPERLTANTPYNLADGRVRIEWFVDQDAKYVSFLTFNGDKLSEVRTSRARIVFKRSLDKKATPNG